MLTRTHRTHTFLAAEGFLGLPLVGFLPAQANRRKDNKDTEENEATLRVAHEIAVRAPDLS